MLKLGRAQGVAMVVDFLETYQLNTNQENKNGNHRKRNASKEQVAKCSSNFRAERIT
jgi:hypothetical protein